MSASLANYVVRNGRAPIPIARREVRRVVVSSSHISLELSALRDPLTTIVDLFVIDAVEFGRAHPLSRQVPGLDSTPLAALLGRRVTSCIATPDGHLEIRLTGSAAVQASGWAVAFGDGRHWTPHVDGRLAEWKPTDWEPQVSRPRRRAPRREHQIKATEPIPLNGQQLGELGFRDGGLLLSFEVGSGAQPNRQIERLPDIEIEMNGTIALEPDAHVIDTAAPGSAAPLLALVDIPTAGATASPAGILEIRFTNGTLLTAGPRNRCSWSVDAESLGIWYMRNGSTVTFSERIGDRPLDPAGRASLVRAFLEYAASDRPDLFWASDRLRELVWHAPEDAYEVVRDLIRQAPSPYVLSIVAAGPLEDLLSDWGERFIERLESDARVDAKLRAACGRVWRMYMPDSLWERLRRIVTGES